jgi:hypothetical protein
MTPARRASESRARARALRPRPRPRAASESSARACAPARRARARARAPRMRKPRPRGLAAEPCAICRAAPPVRARAGGRSDSVVPACEAGTATRIRSYSATLIPGRVAVCSRAQTAQAGPARPRATPLCPPARSRDGPSPGDSLRAPLARAPSSRRWLVWLV